MKKKSFLLFLIITLFTFPIHSSLAEEKNKENESRNKDVNLKEINDDYYNYHYDSRFYINFHLGIPWTIGNSNNAGSIGGHLGIASGYHFNESISTGLFYQIGGSLGFFDENTISPAISLIQLYGIEFDYYIPLSSESRFDLGLKSGFVNTTSINLFLYTLPVGSGRYVAPFIGPKFGLRFDHSNGYTFGLEFSPQWVFPTTISTTSFSNESTSVQTTGQFRIEFALVFALRP